jgi:glycosyltransferase involved in cell wall biosynthesis
MRARGLALKFFEYFISGKPVLATPYTDFEIEEKELLYIEEDAAAWGRAIDTALADPAETDRGQRRMALARLNTYRDRVAQQREIIERLSAARAAD